MLVSRTCLIGPVVRVSEQSTAMCLSADSNIDIIFTLDIGDSCLEALHSVRGNGFSAQTHAGAVLITSEFSIVVPENQRVPPSLGRVESVLKSN